MEVKDIMAGIKKNDGDFLVTANTARLGDDALHVLNLPLATGEGAQL